MAIFGNMINTPGFIKDGEELNLPVGSRVANIDAHKPERWALYVNDDYNLAWLAIKAYYNGILGWKIIKFQSIPAIQYVNDYVKSCSQCLENF